MHDLQNRNEKDDKYLFQDNTETPSIYIWKNKCVRQTRWSWTREKREKGFSILFVKVNINKLLKNTSGSICKLKANQVTLDQIKSDNEVLFDSGYESNQLLPGNHFIWDFRDLLKYLWVYIKRSMNK